MTVTAADILRKAIENWETKGWIQHRPRNDAGATCSVGGIEYAAISETSFNAESVPFALYRAFDRASLAFRNAIEDGQGHINGIIHWNDMPGRTVEDVILTAKRAIEKLETELSSEPTF